MTLTTADEDLCALLEPNVCSTQQRVAVLAQLAELGIPTVVWICTILPFINDTIDNIAHLLDNCITAKVSGIIQFGMGVTVREGNRQYFYRQLDKHFPQLLYQYQQQYGNSYELLSDNDSALIQYIHAFCQQHNIMSDRDQVFAYLSSLPQ